MADKSKKEPNRRLTPSELDELAEKYATIGASDESVTREHTDKEKTVVEEEPVVKEIVKEVEMRRVQPIIHRVREQTEIRHIIKPIIQRETAPVEASQVIRETGIIREQVPFRQECACADRSACTCQYAHSEGELSREIIDSGAHHHHHHLRQQHQSQINPGGAFAATASVSCTHSGEGPAQIHIQPVIYYIAPGMNINMQHLTGNGELCHSCSSKVTYHKPISGDGLGDAHSEGEGERDKQAEAEAEAGGHHRLSRIMNKFKRRSLRKSRDDIDSSTSRSSVKYDSYSSDEERDDADNVDEGEGSCRHVDFAEKQQTAGLDPPDEVTVERIIHTPVVI